MQTLIRKGFKVAVCEQTEDPAEAKKRGSKSVVAREVVRVVTPGTLTEDQLLERAAAQLSRGAGARGRRACALAWTDISDGVVPCDGARAGAICAHFGAHRSGGAFGAGCFGGRRADRAAGARVRAARDGACRRSNSISAVGERALKAQFKVAALDAFGNFSRAEISAAGAVLGYLELTQKGQLPALLPPRQQVQGHVMAIDAATRRNLELVETLVGRGQGQSAFDDRPDR